MLGLTRSPSLRCLLLHGEPRAFGARVGIVDRLVRHKVVRVLVDAVVGQVLRSNRPAPTHPCLAWLATCTMRTRKHPHASAAGACVGAFVRMRACVCVRAYARKT